MSIFNAQFELWLRTLNEREVFVSDGDEMSRDRNNLTHLLAQLDAAELKLREETPAENKLRIDTKQLNLDDDNVPLSQIISVTARVLDGTLKPREISSRSFFKRPKGKNLRSPKEEKHAMGPPNVNGNSREVSM